MSSYQEGQLLCGHPRPNRRDSGALSKVLTSHFTRLCGPRHRPSTVEQLLLLLLMKLSVLFLWCQRFFHGNSRSAKNIVLYNCALKHPKTIHLSPPLCKGHNCSTVQHNFILAGMSTHHSSKRTRRTIFWSCAEQCQANHLLVLLSTVPGEPLLFIRPNKWSASTST